MQTKTSSRIIAIALCVMMALSVIPFAALAYNANYESQTHTVFKHKEQTLAPGVEYYQNYAYAEDGKQMVYYVATAEIDRDDVLVMGSYKDMQIETKGMAKLTEQVAVANAKYSDPSDPDFVSENFTVVAGTNGDFYNMQTGQPSGAFAINGQVMNNSNNRPWFAIFADGTALCGNNASEYEAAIAEHGAVQNSVGGSQMLVIGGADVTASASGSYNTDRHSRTMIGVTADNKVVCAVLDGRQEPFSCGGTMHELAQIMIEAGCEVAINLDGGGSTTFGARPEGEDEFKVINRPSDGSERSISSGVIIASLAAASDEFERAAIEVESDYVTPYSEVAFDVTGVSSSGASADLPADIAYTSTLGTIVDGKFVSDGTVGEAVISAVYGGEVVGSAVINVVVPESIAFASDTFTVPFDASGELAIKATYGLNEVTVKASDFIYALEDADAGVLENGYINAPAEASGVTGTTVYATLIYDDTVTATAAILYGKGSEVIFDFEDGTTQGFGLNYSNYNYYLPNKGVFVADRENGKVHSGNYSLGLHIDYSNSQEAGYQMVALYQGQVSGNINYYEDALTLGTWLYIPDEYVGLWVRWTIAPITAITENAETGEKTYSVGSITSNTMDGGAGGTGVVYSFDESGWHYLTADLSSYKGLAWRDFYYCMQFYISDRDGTAYGYYAKNAHNINGDFTLYMDDVTVDYSTVINDRQAPVFSSVLLGDRGPHSNEALVLENGYVSDGYDQISLSARVADFAADNASGIDASSATAFIDGNEMGVTYANGIISIGEEWKFTAGRHTVKFVVYDNAGNRASVTRYFDVVLGNSKPFIKVVAHDPTLDRVLHGSIIWIDIVSADAAKTTDLTTTLNLDSMSTWELDHMIVADGFAASYEVLDEGDKIVKIYVDKVGECAEGEQILVSIPIRTWELDNMNKVNALSAKNWNYAEFKASNEFWPVATEVRIEQGFARRDGSRRFFTGENIFISSESFANYANMKILDSAYLASWNGGHDHRAEYADYYAASTTNHTTEGQVIYLEGFEPYDATCTEAGFTGRTYCTVCNSVVDWGEEIPAYGHKFAIDETTGLMTCATCQALANEEIEGILYVDGAAAQGIVGDKYYVDGVAADYDGLVEIDGILYEFDNGVCLGKFSGLLEDKNGTKCVVNGVQKFYWYQDADTLDMYYFAYPSGYAVTGEKRISNHNYLFNDDGVLVRGSLEQKDGHYVYYLADKRVINRWETIDGAKYFFNAGQGYALTGYARVAEGFGTADDFLFTNEGVLIEMNGVYANPEDGETYYLEAGRALNAGLVQDAQGNYYYINSTRKAVKNCSYVVTNTNGLMEEGTYAFDAEGKMILEAPQSGLTFDADGEIRYYVDGVATYAGLVEYEGDFYYINSSKKAVKNTTYVVTKTNDLIASGTYAFDADGKMIIVDPANMKNGLVFDADGEIRYYVDDVAVYAGLVEYEGDYYYINSSKKALKNTSYVVTKTNGLLASGTYEFDADGKMILEAPKNGLVFDNDGEIRYYVDGVATYAGLVEYEGDYYYINSSKKAVKNTSYVVTKTNDLMASGTYAFDADGKMIIVDPSEMKNGLVFDADGEIRYYVDDVAVYAGLVEYENSYYYINSSKKAVKNTSYVVSKTNGLVASGTYAFDADGKMIVD